MTAEAGSDDGRSVAPRVGLYLFRGMVALGADLTALGNEGSNILLGPILGLRLELVEWLPGHGVDPNRGCSEDWETICDIAILDYEFEAWIARATSLQSARTPQ